MFFSTLESLILKQKKPNELNKNYFLKIWKFTCGNDYIFLKDQFSSFVVRNYTKFIHIFAIFPSMFSVSALEEHLRLKEYYQKIPGGKPSEESLRKSFKDQTPNKTFKDQTPNKPDNTPPPPKLDIHEQLLFKLLFLIVNSVGPSPNLKLLSSTLSDELFLNLVEVRDCIGYNELWYMINFFEGTECLQEFMIKLFRFHSQQYLLFYLSSSVRSLSKLEEKQLSSDKKGIVRKFKLFAKKPKKAKGEEPSPIQQIEDRRFLLCKQAIHNLKSSIEYDNQTTTRNMLLLILRFLFSRKGFLGRSSDSPHTT